MKEMILEDESAWNDLSMQFRGEPARTSMYIRQVLNLQGTAGDMLVLGGWSCTRNVLLDGVKRFGFVVSFGSSGSYSAAQLHMFNAEDMGWQYAAFLLIALPAYDSMRVDITYARNANAAQFTNIFLHKEAYGRSHLYDANGNVTSSQNYAGQKSSIECDSNNNPISYVSAGRGSSEKYALDYGVQMQRHLPVAEKNLESVYIRHSYITGGLPPSESAWSMRKGKTPRRRRSAPRWAMISLAAAPHPGRMRGAISAPEA